MKRLVVLAIALVFLTGAPLLHVSAKAATCTAADFGAVVDQTAGALRTLNADGAKRYQTKIARLREKHALSEAELKARTSSLQDGKIEEFNSEISKLVGQMDMLSRTPGDKVTCQKLDELKRVRDRLLTVMGQKSGYMLARAEVLFDNSASPQVAKQAKQAKQTRNTAKPVVVSAPATTPKTSQPPKSVSKTPKTASVSNSATPALPERRPAAKQRTASGWSTENRPTNPDRIASAEPQNLQPPFDTTPGEAPTLPPPGEGDDTYSIQEVRDAGRGIFGTITAEFAGAINFAFKRFGQPNAFILGQEGGGAFLAGLRYGKGKIHRKGVPVRKIYWQGPSAGLDLGAQGSRTFFLVYNLDDPSTLYGRFSGIGGDAYVAGGIGINVLGKGKVILVPIRSGVGLRIGANLSYLKFTDHQTWNPF
ncbi:MAG: EipA family protein [Alphaproteobacteria bacterium]